MDNRPYIESYYYPTEPKKRKKPQPFSQIAEQGLPRTQQDIMHTNRQAMMDPIPAYRVASYSVPEHYFAPKPVIERPLIESSYCETTNSYTIDYFMEGRPKINRDEISVDMVNVPCPVSAKAIDVFKYSPNVATQQNYQPYHETPDHQKAAFVEAPITDQTKGFTTSSDTAAGDRYKEKTYEVSEYAWRRHDEEAAAQYALPYQHISTTGKETEVVKNQLQDAEVMPRFLAEEFGVQKTKPRREEEDVYSEYLGIPNDLYLAYSTKQTIQYKSAPALSAKPPPKYEIRSVGAGTFNIVQQPPSSAIENDTDRFDEVTDDTVPYHSRFSPHIKPELNDLAPPPPDHIPLAANYAPQYSMIGNAFAPVRHQLVSEYQLEDLNDLTSCIDVL